MALGASRSTPSPAPGPPGGFRKNHSPVVSSHSAASPALFRLILRCGFGCLAAVPRASAFGLGAGVAAAHVARYEVVAFKTCDFLLAWQLCA